MSHILLYIVTYTRRKYLFLLNWNPSFQFASLSSDLANRLHK